eukprot:1144560-Pelagomonas_calceolata.AAC.1
MYREVPNIGMAVMHFAADWNLAALSGLRCKAISKGRLSSSIVAMDDCRHEKVLEQDMVP